MIEQGICKAITHTLDKIQKKSEPLLTELMWSIYYLIDSKDDLAYQVFTQIPDLISRITSELQLLS